MATNSRAIYVRYIIVGKMIIRNRGLLSLPIDLEKDASAARKLGIKQRDDPALYISSVENILLMIQAVDEFFKNDQKPAPAPLHANSLCRHATVVSDQHHVRHLEQDKEQFPTFALFF